MNTIELRNGKGVTVDYDAVLKALNLNPHDPQVQAAVMICDRYGLDPLLKHVILIKGTPYVTRDGYLHLAHQSLQLDGIEVVEEGETGSHWWARVSVFRKDMSRPFTYVGRYPKTGTNRAFGPEMAITRAETHSLRRAFSVTGVASYDEVFDAPAKETATVTVEAPRALAAPRPADPATGEVIETRTKRRPPNNVPGAKAEVTEDARARLVAEVKALGPKGTVWIDEQAAIRGIPNILTATFTPGDVKVLEALIKTAKAMDVESTGSGDEPF